MTNLSHKLVVMGL